MRVLNDFDQTPFIAIWETTRACALKCLHCRAEAENWRDSEELDTEEGFSLLKEIRRFGKPLTVLTGGDPMRRADIFDLVEYGAYMGLSMALTPSGTGEVSPEKIQKLKNRGLARLAVSLDGSSAARHDGFRGVNGSYEWTLKIVQWAKEAGLPVQINTTISRHNLDDLDDLCLLMQSLGIVMWSVFFLVPVGRASLEDGVSARDYERTFRRMLHLSKHVPFDIKSTEAPHYRRVVIQNLLQSQTFNAEAATAQPVPGLGRAPLGVNDGKGFVFVSHKGEIYPSGFLPLSAGNVKRQSLVDVYRNSPLFKRIRDYTQLKGKCGACSFKAVCGGSRARAYAVTGDYMESEPFCLYIPKGYEATDEERRFW